jgi:thiamine biosynthesis protein ThiI
MEQKKEILEAAALEFVNTLPGESFRITTRRSDPNIPLSTQKMNEEIGAAVVEKFGKKVNLTQPDVNCHIDLVEDSAFVYAHRIDGFGGLPVGMGGKVLSMILRRDRFAGGNVADDEARCVYQLFTLSLCTIHQ